jgi:hypothetical protein
VIFSSTTTLHHFSQLKFCRHKYHFIYHWKNGHVLFLPTTTFHHFSLLKFCRHEYQNSYHWKNGHVILFFQQKANLIKFVMYSQHSMYLVYGWILTVMNQVNHLKEGKFQVNVRHLSNIDKMFTSTRHEEALTIEYHIF